MNKFSKKVFNSNGSWVCPAGVTKVLVYGIGGGAGGTGGYNSAATNAGNGGQCAYMNPVLLDVVPNTSYSITIGTGGTGSAGGAFPGPGGAGTNTSFGALMTWSGAPATKKFASGTFNTENYGIIQFRSTGGGVITSTNMSAYPSPGIGAATSISSYPNSAGQNASNGTASGTYYGGAAGMSTSLALGGAGGNGNSAGGGGAGGNAPANSGAGGGGGGNGTSGGFGGNGGSGQLIVMWVE